MALRTVKAGTTKSYAQLASQVGTPAAVRAVGAANGANPVAVVLPCHRIIGSNGSLTGYGGGIDRKRWLLDHEGVKPHAVLTIRGAEASRYVYAGGASAPPESSPRAPPRSPLRATARTRRRSSARSALR